MALGLGFGLGLSKGGGGSGLVTGERIMLAIGDSTVFQGVSNPKYANSNISAITQANPGVVTKSGHLFATGDKVYHHSVVGMTEVNDVVYTVTVSDANNYSLGVNTSGYTAYSTVGRAFAAEFSGSGGGSGLSRIGFLTHFLHFTGQRFKHEILHNRGVASETTANVITRLEESIPAGLGITEVLIHIGTNDASNSVALATFQTNYSAIIARVHEIGARAIVCTITPKDADGATPKSLRNDYNTWIRTLGSTVPGEEVYVCDWYDAIATGDSWRSGYSQEGDGSGVHQNQIGATVMAQELRDTLAPIYGYGTWELQAGNVLLNPTFSGTGGTALGTTFTNNGMAANWSAVFLGTVNSAYRTLSKNGSDQQVLTYAVPAGGSSGEGAYFSQTVNAASLVADAWYVAEALVSLDSFTGPGLMMENCLYLRSNNGVIAHDAAGSVTGGSVTTYPVNTTEVVLECGTRALHLKTRPMKNLSTFTSLNVRIQQRFKTDVDGIDAVFRVLGAQLYQVDDPYA